MALLVSYCEVSLLKDANGSVVQVLGAQIGGESLAVSAAVTNGTTALVDCLAHFYAEEPCWYKLGVGAVAARTPASNAAMFAAERETRFLKAGQRLSVIGA